jgi:hypothetical protein
MMRDLLERQPHTQGKVEFAWAVSAGPALRRAATLDWTPDGVLIVRARTDAWRREIARAVPTIRARMHALLGPDVVTTLRIV